MIPANLPFLYEEAAELLANRETNYCCGAIMRASFHNNERYNHAKELLVVYFKPDRKDEIEPWWDSNETEPRIYALLFMALISEDLQSASTV